MRSSIINSKLSSRRSMIREIKEKTVDGENWWDSKIQEKRVQNKITGSSSLLMSGLAGNTVLMLPLNLILSGEIRNSDLQSRILMEFDPLSATKATLLQLFQTRAKSCGWPSRNCLLDEIRTIELLFWKPNLMLIRLFKETSEIVGTSLLWASLLTKNNLLKATLMKNAKRAKL